MTGRKRKRRLVGRGVRAIVSDCKISDAGDFEPGNRLGVARFCGRAVTVKIANACEDCVNGARFRADEVRVARLQVSQVRMRCRM